MMSVGLAGSNYRSHITGVDFLWDVLMKGTISHNFGFIADQFIFPDMERLALALETFRHYPGIFDVRIRLGPRQPLPRLFDPLQIRW
jgi:hypothetical protein